MSYCVICQRDGCHMSHHPVALIPTTQELVIERLQMALQNAYDRGAKRADIYAFEVALHDIDDIQAGGRRRESYFWVNRHTAWRDMAMESGVPVEIDTRSLTTEEVTKARDSMDGPDVTIEIPAPTWDKE